MTRRPIAALFLLACTAACGAPEEEVSASHAPVPPPSLPDLPFPLHAHGAAVCDDRIWITGGATEEGASRRMLSIGGGESQWRDEGETPEPFVFHGMAALDGRLYVAGGIETPARAYRFDTARRRWERLPDLPTPRDRVAACVLGGRFHVIGGLARGAQGALENRGAHEVFDAATGTWRSLAPLPTSRHGHTAVACGDAIVCTGGGDGAAGRAEVYDVATDTWRAGAPCPLLDDRGHARPFNLLFAGAVAFRDRVYHFGARDYDPIPILAYDPKDDTWHVARREGPLVHRAPCVRWRDAAVIPGGESSARGGPNVLRSVAVLPLAALARSGR